MAKGAKDLACPYLLGKSSLIKNWAARNRPLIEVSRLCLSAISLSKAAFSDSQDTKKRKGAESLGFLALSQRGWAGRLGNILDAATARLLGAEQAVV